MIRWLPSQLLQLIQQALHLLPLFAIHLPKHFQQEMALDCLFRLLQFSQQTKQNLRHTTCSASQMKSSLLHIPLPEQSIPLSPVMISPILKSFESTIPFTTTIAAGENQRFSANNESPFNPQQLLLPPRPLSQQQNNPYTFENHVGFAIDNTKKREKNNENNSNHQPHNKHEQYADSAKSITQVELQQQQQQQQQQTSPYPPRPVGNNSKRGSKEEPLWMIQSGFNRSDGEGTTTNNNNKNVVLVERLINAPQTMLVLEGNILQAILLCSLNIKSHIRASAQQIQFIVGMLV